MLVKDYRKREIRIETERWEHISRNHPETENNFEYIRTTISDPDFVQTGNKKELLAIKLFDKTPVSYQKYCVVVYKLHENSGFIITAYFTRRPSFKRRLIWKKQ